MGQSNNGADSLFGCRVPASSAGVGADGTGEG